MRTMALAIRWLLTALLVVLVARSVCAQTTQQLALGQMASGQFTTQNEAAYYEVTATTADPLVVALRGSTISAAYKLEVHQGTLAGPSVGVLREYDTDKSVEILTPSPGTYVVTVLSTTSGSRTFDLQAQQRAPVSLTIETTLASQSLWSAGDAQYYRFASVTSDSLIVMLKGSGFASGYALEVHEGLLSGTAVGTPWSLNNDLSLEVTAPSPTDYFVIVRGVAGRDQTFDIKVEQRAVVQAPPGTTLSDQPLWTIGDAWYFHIAAASSDPLLVMVQGSTFSQSYQVELHQGSPVGTALGTPRAYQYGQSLEVQTPTPGDYFVVVRAVATDAGKFNLRVIQRPPVIVTPGTPLAAQPLWVPGDTWYYQIAANSDPLVALLRGSVPASGYEFELHQGSLGGPKVGTALDGTNDKSIELVAPSTGTYFAIVRSITDGERTFDLDVEQRNVPTVIDTSSFTDQTLWSLGDTRYYRVTAVTTDPLLIMLQGSTFAPDYVMEVRQGSVTGPTVGVTSEQGNDKSVTVNTPTIGDYYVVVRNAIDGARSYSLRFDQRNTQSLKPAEIVRDQQLSGQGDTRYYVVPVTGADGLVVSLQGSDFATNYVVTVHQGSMGGPSVGLTRHEGNNLFVDIVAPQVGDYYIEVQNGRSGSRSYTIQVDQVGASIVSISPKTGGNAGRVTATIESRYLAQFAEVHLVGTNGSEVVGSGPNSVDSYGRFSATFDLRGLAAGQYDVVVTKADGGEVRLAAGFGVENGGYPRLWVQITGRDTIRAGRRQPYWIAYGNSGNVDAEGGRLVVQLSGTRKYQLGNEGEAEGSIEPVGREILLASVAVETSHLLAVNVEASEATSECAVGASVADSADCWRNGSEHSTTSDAADCRSFDESVPSRDPTAVLQGDEPIPPGYVDLYIVDDPEMGKFEEAAIHVDKASIAWSYPGQVVETRPYPGRTARLELPAAYQPGTTKPCVPRGYCGSKTVTISRVFSIRPNAAILRTSGTATTDLSAIAQQVRDELPNWKGWEFGNPSVPKDRQVSCIGLVTGLLFPKGLFDCIEIGTPTGASVGGQRPIQITAASAFNYWLKSAGVDYIALPTAMKSSELFQWISKCMPALSTAWTRSVVVVARDPNAKVGTSGSGTPRHAPGRDGVTYGVFFENLETASASAQDVVVTDQLDTSKFDLTTFALGPISFGSQVVTPPPGLKHHVTSVDLRPSQNLLVKVDAELDVVIGLVTWRLSAVDPDTGKPPQDALAGFLPPNTTPPNGEGSVVFTVAPIAGLTTGAEIRNKARIVFDANDPIDTAEWLNTLDNDNPASVIQPALAEVQSETTFQVCWAGADRGAGVLNYTIYVSEDNGPASIWLQNTTMTCGKYKGTPGKSYSFYSVARDQVGNVEAMPSVPDAQTKVDPNAATTVGTGGSTGIGGQSNTGGVQNLGGNVATTGGQSEVDASAGGSSAVASDDAGSPITGGTTAVAAGGTTAVVSVETGGSTARDAGPAEAGSSAGGNSASRSESKGDSGCGCRVGQSRSTTVGAGLLLFAMGLTLRRRRSRRAKRRHGEADTNRHSASCR
jgi:hypothetical protein